MKNSEKLEINADKVRILPFESLTDNSDSRDIMGEVMVELAGDVYSIIDKECFKILKKRHRRRISHYKIIKGNKNYNKWLKYKPMEEYK